LDEVTEIPVLLAAKAIGLYKSKKFERVGGTKPVNVDVRLISTSNRNVKEAIENKSCAATSNYRLNVVPTTCRL